MVVPSNETEDDITYHTIDESRADELRAAQPETAGLEDATRNVKGLGNVTRLRILAFLKQQDLCVHDLSTLLDLSQSAVSHQLKQLKERNLLNRRKEGRVVYYSLNTDGIEDLLDDLRSILLD